MTIHFDWGFFFFGALGGAAVVIVDFIHDSTRKGGLPVKYTKLPFLLGLLCRIVLGAFTAEILGDAHQVTGQLGAFWAGISAPLIVTRLARDSNAPG
jgi:hypothetical protein